MFNLSHKNASQIDLLSEELRIFGVNKDVQGYTCVVGDEKIPCETYDECINVIQDGILELKHILWSEWQNLGDIGTLILNQDHINSGTFENLLFLNAVKKSYLLSLSFSDLEEISNILKKMFNIDIVNISDNFIFKFNESHLKIRVLHYLIVKDLYRIEVIKKHKILNKKAQVSGPWANLDLPMQERAWEWDQDQDYFDNRQKAKREQTRYNPENLESGFFYVWQDLTRDPYSFDDIKKDSPYKSRLLLMIP